MNRTYFNSVCFIVLSSACLSATILMITQTAHADPIVINFSASETQSLIGKDADGNGIRDDVDTYIATRTNGDQNKLSALNQLASDYQKAFLIIQDSSKLSDAVNTIRKSQLCVIGTFANSGREEVLGLMSETFGNREETIAGIRINSVMFKLPPYKRVESDFLKECRFSQNNFSKAKSK